MATSAYGTGSGPRGLTPPGEVKGSVPGRKVHSSGSGYTGAKWMFIDSWYIIGPFPNPARRNIETKFPPESVISLDATYIGKEDKPLRWQFFKANRASIRPPDEDDYAIYYAYTTLWFEEGREMWIAVGSDDFSKVWINDMMVWASGPSQKNWKADEGYRRVYFKKGLNRILYRVENGWHGCSFSLMLNMGEA
jgi:hypothetical protein